MANVDRIIIVGGPRCGKSQLSRALRARGYPTFCGDPHDKVKEPEAGVAYLREGMGMDSASSRFIVDNWLSMPGPWVLEGHIMARVLRKWIEDLRALGSGNRHAAVWPCDRVVVFPEQHPEADITAKQASMHKGVIETTWAEIADYFEGITVSVDWRDPAYEGLSPAELADLILAFRR